MDIYENLHKIHDAVIDWDNPFDYTLEYFMGKPFFYGSDLKKHVIFSESPMPPSNDSYIEINSKLYYITPTGFLWPI